MLKTKYTNKDQLSILNEFFWKDSGNLVKGIPLSVFRKNLLAATEKIIENCGVFYTSNETGLRVHYFTCILDKLLKKFTVADRLHLSRCFKRLMSLKVFRKIYYCAVSILFSQDFQEVSSMLQIFCCPSHSHYSFCRLKWTELNKFAISCFLKTLNVKQSSGVKGQILPIENDSEDFLVN